MVRRNVDLEDIKAKLRVALFQTVAAPHSNLMPKTLLAGLTAATMAGFGAVALSMPLLPVMLTVGMIAGNLALAHSVAQNWPQPTQVASTAP